MIDGMLDIFGTRLTLTFAAIALLYLLWSTAPIWWSVQRVLRRGDIAQRGTFVFTTVALSYGATALVIVVPGGLAGLYSLLVLPEDRLLSWTVAPAFWIFAQYPRAFAILLALSHLLLTGWITHVLATHWQLLRERSAASLKEPT